MSVPPDRMAVRSTGDPNKIMGLPKWAFWVIIVVGLFLAYYIYKRSQLNAATAAAGTAPSDTTQGLTAADIGGTPADNSFATQTDETALEEQIQQLEDAMSQLQAGNGGNGAGITPVGGNSPSVPQFGPSPPSFPTVPELPPGAVGGSSTSTIPIAPITMPTQGVLIGGGGEQR